jgi:hypothetical protein
MRLPTVTLIQDHPGEHRCGRCKADNSRGYHSGDAGRDVDDYPRIASAPAPAIP